MGFQDKIKSPQQNALKEAKSTLIELKGEEFDK